MDGLAFLKERGVDLSVICQLGGHSTKRTHRNKSGPNVGFAIISELKKLVESTPAIQVVVQATVQSLITENDETTGVPVIKGITYEKDDDIFTVDARAVVLTTGLILFF